MKYIASLYSLGAKGDGYHAITTRQARVNYTRKRLAQLMHKGEVCYSPISHCHELSIQEDLPKEYLFWKACDRHMIAKSDGLIVLMMEDEYGSWKDSEGMTDEIEYKYLNLHNSMNIEYKYMRTSPFYSTFN